MELGKRSFILSFLLFCSSCSRLGHSSSECKGNSFRPVVHTVAPQGNSRPIPRSKNIWKPIIPVKAGVANSVEVSVVPAGELSHGIDTLIISNGGDPSCPASRIDKSARKQVNCVEDNDPIDRPGSHLEGSALKTHSGPLSSPVVDVVDSPSPLLNMDPQGSKSACAPAKSTIPLMELPSGQLADGKGILVPVPELAFVDRHHLESQQISIVALCTTKQQAIEINKRRQDIASEAAIENFRLFPNVHTGVITRSMTRSGSSGNLPLSQSP